MRKMNRLNIWEWDKWTGDKTNRQGWDEFKMMKIKFSKPD